ncbi:MAG: transcription antitermination factor NusB [Pseudomonadota bacterium]
MTENRRTLSRLAAVQALYQMEQTQTGVDTTILEFKTHRLGGDIDGVALKDADDTFFEDIVRGVVDRQSTLDSVIETHLASGWRIGRIDATARAILRSGIFELSSRPDVPPAAVVDEYVGIANSFFDKKEAAFINGVLDAVKASSHGDESPRATPSCSV